MIKFLMNLFNIGKKKKNEIRIEVDKDNSMMRIISNRELAPNEIENIVREYFDE